MAAFWSDKRVVVTGGAGFLGSFLVERLRAKDCRAIVVPRSKDYDLVEMDAPACIPSEIKSKGDIETHVEVNSETSQGGSVSGAKEALRKHRRGQ